MFVTFDTMKLASYDQFCDMLITRFCVIQPPHLGVCLSVDSLLCLLHYCVSSSQGYSRVPSLSVLFHPPDFFNKLYPSKFDEPEFLFPDPTRDMAGLILNASHAGTPMPSDKLFRAHSKLPPDILIMIFEELLGKHPSISSLRLVSQQFNDLVLPISYRHVVLSDRIVDSNFCDYNNETASSYKMQVKRDVSRYAQHITIKEDFHAGNLHKLLFSLASFRSLT